MCRDLLTFSRFPASFASPDTNGPHNFLLQRAAQRLELPHNATRNQDETFVFFKATPKFNIVYVCATKFRLMTPRAWIKLHLLEMAWCE